MNDSNSTEPPLLPARRPRRLWPYVLLAVALGLPVPTFLALRWLGRLRGSSSPQTSVVVASFLADFQADQPKQGWHYYWNENGPVGQTNAYVELHWNGKNYVPPDPIPPAGAYIRLSNRSAHPGQGPAQNVRDDNEHAVILAYTIEVAGRYAIRNSFISRHDGAAGGAIHLRVFANDREMAGDLYCRTREKTSFDRELGNLAMHDTIYVCIGPAESDYHDSFGIDFSIERF